MRYFPRELDLLHGLTMICASPHMDHKSQGTNQSITVTFGTVRIVRVRPSVCLSHHSTASAARGGFAAERDVQASCIDQQRRTPGARQQRRRNTRPQHGAQQQIRRAVL